MPTSTIDLSLRSGEEIEIEERHGDEVRHVHGVPVAPKDVPVFNPAFDVTPHRFITGIITEEGMNHYESIVEVTTFLFAFKRHGL